MSIDGSITLLAPTLSGVLEPGNLTLGDSYLPELELSGSLEPALPMPLYDLAAQGYAGTVADGAITLLAPTLAGSLEGPLQLPQLTLSATGTSSALITGDVTLLAPTLAGSLEGPLALPQYGVAGVLLAGNVMTGQVTLPQWSVAASSGTAADITLPAWDAAGTGLAGNVAFGAVTLPAWQGQASAYQDTTANGDVTFALLSVSGSMVSETLINGSITLPLASLAATAVSGNVANAVLTLPLMAVDATGYFSNIGHADIVLPTLQLAGTIENATRRAGTTIALNTFVKAVTLYDGLSANSYANFAGMTLAATDAGIVVLSGDTDLGAPINAHITSGIMDFGAVELKRVLVGYVGYRSDGDMDLTLITDQHHEFIYRLQPRQDGADLHPTRVKFGRGISGRYWQWRLENRDGAAFGMNSVNLTIEPRKRRV